MIQSSDYQDQLQLKRARMHPSSFRPLFFSLLFLVFFCIMPVSAQAPVANFTANTTTGHQPLAVQFNDTSTGAPTGWSWYFGDEQFDGAWQQVNVSAGWVNRSGHTSVVLPDGSIVLMGGLINGGVFKNDVWLSADSGATWTEINASAGWEPRGLHTSVVLPDGSIVLMGGRITGGGFKNDVWLSADSGATWTEINASAGWSARIYFTSVVLPDGSIVLMGGQITGDGYKNDVWLSADSGATWTRIKENAEWSAREGHTSVVLPDGSIVLMGGVAGGRMNDIWRSDDGGGNWTRIKENAEWSAREGHTSVVLPDGSIVLMGGLINGGVFKNDVWLSADSGATWTEINASAGWEPRGLHTSVVLPNGSIVLMGGQITGGGFKNDTWRLETAGSTAPNPVHTYPDIGTFRVALQAFNNDGFNNKIVADSITVTAVPAPAPTPSPSGDGGSESAVPTISGVGSVSFLQGRTGQVLQNYDVRSPEGTAHVYLKIGTTALGPDGKAVVIITVEGIEPDAIPGLSGATGGQDTPDGGAFMMAGTGYAVLCSPAGATFSPPVPLTVSFTPEEWEEVLADANGIPGALVIQWYNAEAGVWEEVKTTVDPDARTVTATISHFSTYAVFVVLDMALPVTTPTVTPVVTQVATPVATPLLESTPVSTPPEPDAPFPGTVVIIGVLIAIILISAFCLVSFSSRRR